MDIEATQAMEEAEYILCQQDAVDTLKAVLERIINTRTKYMRITPSGLLSIMWLCKLYGNEADIPSREFCKYSAKYLGL